MFTELQRIKHKRHNNSYISNNSENIRYFKGFFGCMHKTHAPGDFHHQRALSYVNFELCVSPNHQTLPLKILEPFY